MKGAPQRFAWFGQYGVATLLAGRIDSRDGSTQLRGIYTTTEIFKRALNVGAEIFERRYAEAINCRRMRPRPTRILLVDDVCTHGSTFAVASKAIRERYPDCEIVACSAGQMTVRDALAKPDRLLAE